MPRSARVVVAGCPHHITQRGNNRQDIFFVDDDRRVYLDILKQSAGRFGLSFASFCLMTNHVHLVAVPRDKDALSETMRRTSQMYTDYINRMQGRTGHLWEDRFFSCPLDETHFWAAMIYVERNPVRAGMVNRAYEYPWSSAAEHIGLGNYTGLIMEAWPKESTGAMWAEALTRIEDDASLASLRLCTSRGRPIGSDSFISKLETALGRRLRPLPRGRQPKKSQTDQPKPD